MTDLSLTVIPKSDQLNSDDLIAGPRTITVTRVSANPDSMEQPVSVFFEGDGGKPYKPCKIMRRVLIAAWGANGNAYAGRRMTLYCDPKVKFGGLEVGGIRISHMSHIKQPLNMALTVTKAKRAPYRVEPLPDEPDAPDTDAILGKAEEQAAKGSDAFKAWWNTPEAKAHRALLKEHLPRLRDIAEGADKSDGDDADPFDLPPLKDNSDALALLLATIRRDLDGGADPAACEQFHSDAITDALDADPNTAAALDALFAEFEA